MPEKVVFVVEDPKATGRIAAQRFMETVSEKPRGIVWHMDGNFHFADGIKTYGILPAPSGWKIVERGAA